MRPFVLSLALIAGSTVMLLLPVVAAHLKESP